MKTDESLLDDIIKDGQVDLNTWPALLQSLLGRIDEIVHNAFPAAHSTSVVPEPTSNVTPPQATATTNEPASEQPPPTEPVQNDSSSAAVVVVESDQTMASEDMLVLTSLKETLTASFSTSPPHTVQRLAELLRNPNQHYHNLPKYLRALQRVLSVSSTVDQFPLPMSAELPGGILGLSSLNNASLGSDESLGGALLTPISWLKSEGESSEAGIPNGIYRDEAMRLEQEMNSTTAFNTASGESNSDVTPPQAQGPPTIGPEDLGPQPAGLVFPDITDAPSPGKQGGVLASDDKEVKGKEGEGEGGDTAMSNSGEETSEAVDESTRKSEDSMDIDPKADTESGEGSSKDLPTREAPAPTEQQVVVEDSG